MIERVAEPFYQFFCTACTANSYGLSMKQSSFSPYSKSLTAETNLLAYTPESMPILLQPPTPSATSKIFLETNSASSPPFQTLSGCGADPQANLNQYLLSATWLPLRNIFLRVYLLMRFKFYNSDDELGYCILLSTMKGLVTLILFTLAVVVRPSTYILSQLYFTEGFTDNDCNQWAPFGPSVPLLKFSNCSSRRIFGGYNIFVGDPTNPSGITKTWLNLIPHYAITVTATFYKIDSWLNNTIFFMVDGTTAWLATYNSTNGGTSDFCGNPTPIPDTINTNFNDLIVPISFTVPHTASSLTIKVLSNLVGTSGSWGIRNLNITMQACDESCLTCTNGTACTSCDISQGLVMGGSYCVCTGTAWRQKYIPCNGIPCATCLASLPCVNGYYPSSPINYCEPCNIACGSCISPVNSWATCPTCNATGFIRTVAGTACSSCFSGCKTCSGTTATTCLTCKYGYFYDSLTFTCGTSCPNRYYPDESNAYCYPCNPPCFNCIGLFGASYYCLSCTAGNYLYNFICAPTCPFSLYGYQGGCVSSCPIGTYADTGTLTCMPCVANCQECTNGTSCFICNSGAYMYTGLCYINCPVFFYGNNQTQLCLSCHTSCLTCNGPFSDNCMSCVAGVVLISNICYTTCPSNTYSAICSPCDPSCLTCNGPNPTNCLTCSAPLFYHLNLSSCLATCNLGQISNNYNFTCTQCPTGMVAYFQACRTCSTTCLFCNGITFLDCTTCNPGTTLVKSTCVLASERHVIYMPNKANNSSIRDAFLGIFLAHILLCIVVEALFQYKTNLLLTIELFQILSYTQYLTIQLSQSTQRLANFLYITNFAAYVNPITVDPHPSLPSKFQVMGKTGVFMADAFGIQLIMIICITLYMATKYLSNRSDFFKKAYQKINPYLISYVFRLMLLQLGLDIMLYLYCFDAASELGVGSLVLLLIDLTAIVISFCWRIKTEQDGSQFAIFYYNQIGQASRKEQYLPEDQQAGTSVQQKIRKSKILPSAMELLLKMPIPITILYFIGNSSTQSICYFIYFIFYLLLTAILPVRRRAYRVVMLTSGSFLVLNALGAVIVARGGSSNYFDGVWFTILLILFLFTLLQVITNYNYFIQCFSYIRHQAKHGLNSNSNQPHINESHSNLASQQEQSVVFQRRDRQQALKRQSGNHSKALSKGQFNNSWVQQKY